MIKTLPLFAVLAAILTVPTVAQSSVPGATQNVTFGADDMRTLLKAAHCELTPQCGRVRVKSVPASQMPSYFGNTSNRANLLSLLILVTYYGHVTDWSAKHPLGNVVVNVYETTRGNISKIPSYKGGRRTRHVVTDAKGNFVLSNLAAGWYIYTLSSADVPRIMDLQYFSAAHPHLGFRTCSKKFNRSCGPPLPAGL